MVCIELSAGSNSPGRKIAPSLGYFGVAGRKEWHFGQGLRSSTNHALATAVRTHSSSRLYFGSVSPKEAIETGAKSGKRERRSAGVNRR